MVFLTFFIIKVKKNFSFYFRNFNEIALYQNHVHKILDLFKVLLLYIYFNKKITKNWAFTEFFSFLFTNLLNILFFFLYYFNIKKK